MGSGAPPPVPVLVTAHRRPDSLSRVLGQLRRSEVSSVAVWIDGPRSSSESDAVHDTRVVAEEFLSGANDHLRALDVNLGCRWSVTSAVEWFLSEHPHGVILEDDVLPSSAFFKLAGQSLAAGPRFDEVTLGSITGYNFVPRRRQQRPGQLRASAYFSSWGWGTWATQWEQFRMDLLPWPTYATALESPTAVTPHARQYLESIHRRISMGAMDSWAYVALLEQIRLGLRTLVPSESLVENFGFSADATHTRRAPSWVTEQRGSSGLSGSAGRLAIPQVRLDGKADQYMERHVFEFLPRWSAWKTWRRMRRRLTLD